MKKYWTNSFDPDTVGTIFLSSDRPTNVLRRQMPYATDPFLVGKPPK
jgi:hypothetical protein